MTSLDQHLDPVPLLSESLLLHRISAAKYAVLSGQGAALKPGRWNRPKEEAIYTSLEMSTCVLERLAHTQKSTIPAGLASMRVRLSGKWMSQAGLLIDYKTSASRALFTSLRDAQAAYADRTHRSGQCFAIALPSVIVPVWNMVLYPQRPGFWDHVTLESVEAFDYDPRLFPVEAVLSK